MSQRPNLNFESRMLIDGRLVEPIEGTTFDNVNPATEEVIGACSDASRRDMEQAIAAARRAFDETDWATNKALRKQCLEELAEALEYEREEFRRELVAEVGCPVATTKAGQLDGPLREALRWPAKYIEEFDWERDLGVDESSGATNRLVVTKEPVGVVGAIVPWNYPLGVTLDKLGPALAVGNTVVLKAAPDTPFNALRLGRLAIERTNLPPGVLNVVTSSDHLVGEVLTLDPRVDLISFTGSTVTGRRIMEKGAASLKRLFLELGGKSAQILLDGADLEAIVPKAALLCTHAGQGCTMTTRLLVPRSRYEWTLETLKEAFESVHYGDPTDPQNIMGPVINARQRDRILGYIEKGKEEGAAAGYGRRTARPSAQGLLRRADGVRRTRQPDHHFPGGDLWARACVIPHDGDDDAVRIANQSQYGLGGAVNSGSLERSMAVARRIRAGVIGVNGGRWYSPMSPFGGFKQSGLGRQYGREGFEQYLETKTVAALVD